MRDEENNEALNTENETEPEKAPGEKKRKSNNQGIKIFGTVLLLVLLITAAALTISAHDKVSAENALTEAGFFAISSDSVIDMAPYPGGAVVLTSNDIEYIDRYGELMSSNDHTFSSPVMKIAGKDLIVYDRGGYSLKIERSSAKYKQLNFRSAVSCADICSNGTYAYVLNADEGYQSHLYVYSAKGALKFEWGSADYLLCLSLSKNGKYCAVGLISVDDATFASRVLIFDFAKSEPVCDARFAGETVYDIEFVSSKRLAVLTDVGYYLLNSDGSRETVDEYSVTELGHSDMKRDGMSATAINRYGNSGNVLAKIYTKGNKAYYEHSFNSEVTAVCAGETNVAFVFGNEIEIYDQKDVLSGKISLGQACIGCTLSDSRIFVCVPGGIYSFNTNENYEVEQ